MPFVHVIGCVVALVLSGISPAISRSLEAGVAITDSDAMQDLEANGFALSALLSPRWQRGARTGVLNNAELAQVAPLAALRDVVRSEFKLYNEDFLDRFPKAAKSFGTSTNESFRKFERNFLDSAAARFDLVGVVNRMDRTFRAPETCGEVRLLYRLAYRIKAAGMRAEYNAKGEVSKLERDGEEWVQSRLPMAINLVLRARTPPTPGSVATISCQDLARRWLQAGDSARKGRELAQFLITGNGALATIEPSLIDRMETNIQVIRVPSTILPEFGGNAEYLLHIFKWDAARRTFTMDKLENQIDRAEMLKDPAKLTRFKQWLFTPERLHELAEGTIKIPDEYLAYRAVTSAPGGTARATNRPFLGLISDQEAEDALARLREAAKRLDPEGKLRNIETAYGLQQRLTDITCTGCHQSRAIGGFHFLGSDWTSSIRDLPQNAIFVAGSPHFYAELPRRRNVVEAIAQGRTPDYGRGFSMRPRNTARSGKSLFNTDELTSLRKGWGTNCYKKPARATKDDQSFTDWKCADGLVCKALHESDLEPGMGICLDNTPTVAQLDRGLEPKDLLKSMKIGQPFLFGKLSHEDGTDAIAPGLPVHRYRDVYCTTLDVLNNKPRRLATPVPSGACIPVPGAENNQPADVNAPYQKGGFFGGMYREIGCKDKLEPGTVCATEAGTGFNRCITLLANGRTSFRPCLTAVSRKATLRACNATQPCRDDYVCLATKDSLRTGLGACLPPYFLFQFRIDGHPTPPEGPADPI